ncbi:actin cytoskeleton-regulatory complex protein PAN1-like isoform X2 [Acanthopagrus latus]|uniref:actin cytoskeleton-regulatory complex protein PAN1-like isoform X2 n=1 Tax=Acanthopagrus latus TaxID=8177 RepID=UPI00187BE8E0|nr:actin cytoskeleton-regulatory complex protein PAN1-like isoform X2 [Acanthopagrus latus]
MMPEGKRKSLTFYRTAAVVLTCYLVQVTDCYRMTKIQRREGRKEADAGKTIGLQDGRIVFGRTFEKGSQVADGTKKSSNTSVEDESAYQADSWGWSEGHTANAGATEALWRRMNPSLQCGADQMRFRAMGPGSSSFAVEQARAPAIPLTQIPATCGYNMQRNALGFAMFAPYDGCNMVQEGGSYVLPMRWQGIPVSLWCPKPAAQPTAAAPTTAAKHPEMPKFPQYPMYPPFYPLPVTPAPATTTRAPATTPKPHMPTFPPYPFYPLYPPFYPPTTAPPTTAAATTKTPAPVPPFPFPWPYLTPFPFNPSPPTTAPPTTTATTKKPAAPTTLPPASHSHPHGHYPLPYPFPFPPFPYPQPPTTAPPTATTKKPAVPTTLPPASHSHPHGHYPLPYPYPFPPYANIG